MKLNPRFRTPCIKQLTFKRRITTDAKLMNSGRIFLLRKGTVTSDWISVRSCLLFSVESTKIRSQYVENYFHYLTMTSVIGLIVSVAISLHSSYSRMQQHHLPKVWNAPIARGTQFRKPPLKRHASRFGMHQTDFQGLREALVKPDLT